MVRHLVQAGGIFEPPHLNPLYYAFHYISLFSAIVVVSSFWWPKSADSRSPFHLTDVAFLAAVLLSAALAEDVFRRQWTLLAFSTLALAGPFPAFARVWYAIER
jgi:hypothetical protein